MTPMPCRAVVFDFDGTLADSMPFLERIGVEVMMKHYGVSTEDATIKYRTTTGLPYEHQIETNFPEDPKNHSAVEEFERLKIDRIFDQQLFPTTRPAIEAITEKGIKVFVSSSTFQPTIEEYFKRRGMDNLFTSILGYRPGFEKGAHHFNYIREQFRISMDDTVFVGDSLKDYERSKGFCRFVGVLGIFSPEDFKGAGHTGPLVHDLREVADILELQA